jgi:hypothetical protein
MAYNVRMCKSAHQILFWFPFVLVLVRFADTFGACSVLNRGLFDLWIEQAPTKEQRGTEPFLNQTKTKPEPKPKETSGLM